MVYILCKLIQRTDKKTIKECIDEYIQEIIIKKDTLFNIKGFTLNEEQKENVIKLLESKNNYDWKKSTYIYSDMNFGYIGAYCMECLAMALHICYTEGDIYTIAILRITSMGGDADSVGSVVGQILGAYYGFSMIPNNWYEPVFKHDRGSILYRTIKLYEYTIDKENNNLIITHVKLLLKHKILKCLKYISLYNNTNKKLFSSMDHLYDSIKIDENVVISGGNYYELYLKNKQNY